METSINQFTQRLKENRSLKPLYRNADFSVDLSGVNGCYRLAFDRDGCRRIPERNGKADVVISGKEKELVHLLEGKERLLMMMQRQALNAQGSYRCLLKLESLFLLNGVAHYAIFQLS